MNLRQLEILRALVRHRTTVAAAAELALSQPAVSNALKSMEVQTGFPLFERINNRLFPTAEALDICRESDAIFALHTRLEDRVRDLKESRAGNLVIYATPPLAYSVIPPALKRFMARRPGIRVFLDVRRYESTIEGVVNHVADLGFALAAAPHPGLAQEIVREGEMVFACAPDHALARRETITPEDIGDFPLIGLERGTQLGELVRGAFAAAAVPFRPSVEVRYCNTACVLAASGVGVSVVDPFSPRQVSAHDLVTRPFLPRTPAPSHALWSQARPMSRLAAAFLDEVRAASGALPG